MRLKDISHDMGRVVEINWRPVFDREVAQGTYRDFAVPFNGRSRG